jgi:2-polyprenyl-3-methyl-5-hydroxy-6-metoxy-1,4-benzoquinol methylase
MVEPVTMEDAPCPLGCARDDAPVLSGRDLIHGLPGEFSIVRCRGCGLLRTNPRPAPESMGIFYPADYGPYQDTQVPAAGPRPASFLKKTLKTLARRLVNFNIMRWPPVRPGRMLEIGCASGAFLRRMAGEGWEVEGIEFSPQAAAVASGLGFHVHAGPLESAPEPGAPFDLIVGWMVLEHLHDPVAALRKLRAWAKPDARLALSVPNAGSLEFRVFKDRLYALHLPNHLYHFTPATLAKVLRAGGWTIEKVFHQRVLSNLVASTGYVLRDRGHGRLAGKLIDFPRRQGRWAYALYPLAWVMSIFGQTGRMTVWARPDR